jgi:hypothetical protein
MSYPNITDPENHIWYKTNVDDIPELTLRDNLCIELVTKREVEVIQSAIDLFNSEISWDGMFDVEEAIGRMDNGERFYVLHEEGKILGHIWIKNDSYCYNFFVTQNRTKGDSQAFLSKVLHGTVVEYFNFWVARENVRALAFFDKMGFKRTK